MGIDKNPGEIQTGEPNLEHALEKNISRLSRRIEKLDKASGCWSNIRLGAALGGVALIWGCSRFFAGWPVYAAVAASLAAFCAAVYQHNRIHGSIEESRIRVRLKSEQIARIRLDWERMPRSAATAAAPDSHPFGADLDVTGGRSLHRLIDASISLEGGEKLMGWLLETKPDPRAILRRQELVKELSALGPFREKLIASASRLQRSSGEMLELESLLHWFGKRESAGLVAKSLAPMAILAISGATASGLAFSGLAPAYLCILPVVYLAILIFLQGEISKTFRDAIAIETSLQRLHTVFQHLEEHRHPTAPNLTALCTPFLDRSNRPSTHLRRIAGIVSAISVRANPVVWLLLNGLLPWDVFFLRRLEQRKETLLKLLPGWLETLAELEALCSLANFAHLNPDYSYPEIIGWDADPPPDSGTARPAPMSFHAEALGHPLIAGDRRVRNDFSLNEESRIALITGSNMAGKSTFLRTVGVNLCLANAGAPVCAAGFRTTPFRIFACMRNQDSLIDGFSFFHAEVRRLRLLLTTIESDPASPVLFLLDEIFRGTNNRERFIGSRALILALAGHAAAGAIATHDLQLVALAEESPAIANFHFREEVEGNRMVFDYKLRTGPCPTTNALKIMAMEGLPV
jgi:hypothetical protein